MSFKNANQSISKFVSRAGRKARFYEVTRAVLLAARLNDAIQAEDFGIQGKKRKFKINFYPTVCNAEGSCTDSVCAPGTVLEPRNELMELKRCTASKVFQLNVNDIRFADDGGMSFSDHAQAQIASTLGSMRKVLAEDITAVMISRTGLQPDGNATRRLNFANGTNGQVNPVGKYEVERIFSDSGYDQPFIVGGTEVDNWKRSTALGGTSAGGIDTARLGSERMYYDALVNQTYGDGGEHVLAFDPRVFKFIAWSANQGMFATDLTSVTDLDKLFKQSKDGSIRGSLVDRTDDGIGLLWDIRIKFFDCGGPEDEGYYTYQYKLIWDLVFMPDEDCNIQGVNGLFHFTTCAPVLAPCPTGDPVPAPQALKTYQWTPGSIFPLYAANMLLAGVATEPKVNVTSLGDLAAMMTANTGLSFTVSGSTIRYQGYSPIGGNINGNVTITFTVVP